MNQESLIEILLNNDERDKTIIKSFYPKMSLSPVIF